MDYKEIGTNSTYTVLIRCMHTVLSLQAKCNTNNILTHTHSVLDSFTQLQAKEHKQKEMLLCNRKAQT